MTILPLDPAANRNPAALRDFILQCQKAAVAKGRPQLVSISLEVAALDPLAVLESIFEAGERHFYAERPAENFAIAGAEAVLSFVASGPERFAECQRFIDETLAATIVVGDQSAPFSGPHFFTSFTFLDHTEAEESFEAACVFVPRWQVARRGERTVAVANLAVAPDSNIDAMAEKLWRAHAKFGAFDYGAAEFEATAAAVAKVEEVGGRPDAYRESVQRALRQIEAGHMKKIVLARAKDLTATRSLHPLQLLNGLRQRFADCYAFSVANGRGQSFIGASPERLLRVERGVLSTLALAGSIGRGATASEDVRLGNSLLNSEKDLREHRLVLSSIERRLAALGVAPEFRSAPTLLRLANVQHLHTPIRAQLPLNVRVLDVVARIFPTPAVGGSPRDVAVSRIRSLESFPRGLYAGAIGWIDARGDGEFFIGLRSALIDGARARLYAGAGIVAGSEPEKEFAETEWKFKAMQDALLAP